MAEITVAFEGNGGCLILKYSSGADVFNKRIYSGLELRNLTVELKGKTRPEISDSGLYSLRSTAVEGVISRKII